MAVSLPSTLSDHPSLIGIVRMPYCSFVTEEVEIPNIIQDVDMSYKNILQKVDMALDIKSATQESSWIYNTTNKITDFYPYTYYALTDGEADPLILHPQYLPNKFYVTGCYALSHQPVERYYVDNYKGDTQGRVYNITNTNQMMLPTASNSGLQYLQANANTIMQTRKTQVLENTLGVVNAIGGAVKNPISSLIGGATGLASGLNNLQSIDSRNKDTMLTPSSISSFGTPSTRKSFGTNNVRVIKYSVRDNVKSKIESYVQRYGNKYNNYASINHKTYKGFIKFISPDIDTGIDNIYTRKIIEILERGVYIE